MRILFTSISMAGHLNPLLPYAKAFQEAGDDVRIALARMPGSDPLEAKVEKAGIDCILAGSSSMEDLIEAFAGTQDLSDDERDRLTIPRLFVDLASRRALPAIRGTVRDWSPDLIIRETSEYAGMIAADEAGIPHMRVAIMHSDWEKRFAKYTPKAVDSLRQSIGLAPNRGASLREEHVFTAFPPAFGDSKVAEHAPAPMRVRMPSVSAEQPLTRPHWAGGPGEDLVYVTFGTMSGTTDTERAMYRLALDAVADLPVRVLLTTGPAMAEHPLGEIPSNVTVKTYVPQNEVFKYAKLVVCHGGSGTVLGALAAGLPQVVVPLFADQPGNALSVQEAKAGVAAFDADATSLKATIQKVLWDDSFRRGAERIAAEISAMPDLPGAIAAMRAIVSDKSLVGGS